MGNVRAAARCCRSSLSRALPAPRHPLLTLAPALAHAHTHINAHLSLRSQLHVRANGTVTLELGGLPFAVTLGVPRQQYQHVIATMPRRQLKALRETFKGGSSGGGGSGGSSSGKGARSAAKQSKAAAKADSKGKGKGRSATAKGAEGGGAGEEEDEEDDEEEEDGEEEEEEEDEEDEDDDTDEDEAAEAEAERLRSALAAKAAREAGYLEESEEEEEEDGGAGGAKLTSELGSAFGLATRVRPGAVAAGDGGGGASGLRKRRALVHLGCVAHTLTVSPDLEAMLAEADAAAREKHGPIMGGGLTHASRLLQEYLALGPGEGSALMRARRAGGRRERAESAESMA